MFYGWGSDSERWALGDGRTLVFAYKYISLMFVFRLAYKKRWLLLADSRSQDVEVTRAELVQRYGPDLPRPGLWSQYGLLLGFTAFVLVAIVASAF